VEPTPNPSLKGGEKPLPRPLPCREGRKGDKDSLKLNLSISSI